MSCPLSPTATPGAPLAWLPRACLQWYPPVWRQSGCRSGAGGGAGRPAGGEAGTGATTRRGRLEKRRHCPQRAGQRWQGGERPLADGAEPPGRREAQLVQVSDGPMAARAMSSGLPPPGWTAGPLACPLLPPEVPSSAPGSFHPVMRLPSSLPPSTANSHIQCRIPASGCCPHHSLSSPSDQVISCSVPGATSFQPLSHPILFGRPISAVRSPLHGQQAHSSTIGPSHPWGAGPLSACSVPLICHQTVSLTASRWL